MQPQLIQLQEKVMQIVRAGQGDPLIVLESGLGDGWTSWTPVLESLAERSRVLAYSRPGYDFSSPADTPRDIPTEARELRDLLRMLGDAPPYLLVGHSLGGMIVQAFAAYYPQDVVGVVSIDAPHPDQIEYLNRDDSRAGQAYRAFAATLKGAPRLEHEALTASRGGYFLGNAAPYAGPIIMLAAWLRADAPQAYRQYRRAKAFEAAAQYRQAELRKVFCTHYIHHERPLSVLDAVDEILARARHSDDY